MLASSSTPGYGRPGSPRPQQAPGECRDALITNPVGRGRPRGRRGSGPCVARASAAPGEALSGWRYLCGRLEGRRRFDGEIEAARQAFAEEPSARNWAYLSELQRQRHDMVEEETDSDSETGDRARP